LIRVVAAGVNRADCVQRSGKYPVPPGAPDIIGLEVSGEVVALGEGVERWKTGDAVCALLIGGGYAEYACAPAAQCLPLPSGLDPTEAAALPETCCTVWGNIHLRAGLRPGETLLVQGGSSGIGVTAIQIFAARGHPVYATAGSAEKVLACEQLGARRGIDYRNEDFVAVVKAATDGRGVDVILDMVGGDYIGRQLKALADDGRLVGIAATGGAQANVDLMEIYRRRLTLTGSALRSLAPRRKGEIVASVEENVWPLLANGSVKPVIYRKFPLAEAGQAHVLMESSAHIGKLLLVP
jgi:NADPH2:quinone reductase